MSGGIRSGRDVHGDLALEADVAVVGSGAGGAVVAATLAEAGQRVVVLEEGPHVPASRYARFRPSESMRHMWRHGAMSVAVGVGDTPLINVTMGRCVGGSSAITGGVCFRIPDAVLHTWSRERGLADLTPEKMAPYFDAVERRIGVEEVTPAQRSRSTALFAAGAEALGAPLKPIRRNTTGCRGCGQCNFGCPHHAKRGVDLNYLPDAIAHGATVVSDCLVERVLLARGRAVGVRGRLVTAGAPGRRGGRVHVRARRVVVAAGSYHGPLLLMRSGLSRRRLPALGKHMTLHPAFRMLARFDEPVRGWRGALQSAYSDAYEHEGVTLVGLFIPPGMLAATLPGMGPEHVRRAATVPNLAMFGGIIHDAGGGVVRRGPGREPIVTYRLSRRDRARIPVVIRRMAETFLAAGARELFLPIVGAEPVDADAWRRLDLERIGARQFECASQHPLSSCRMGTDPRRSVVDGAGAVWGLRGLYVADGSVMPSSLGVNPQLGVMAMALRIAHGLRDGRAM